MSEHIYSPDAVAAPPGDFFTWDEYMLAYEQSLDPEGIAWSRRVGKAMRLSPSLEVFTALLAGQEVPSSELDQRWAWRYSL